MTRLTNGDANPDAPPKLVSVVSSKTDVLCFWRLVMIFSSNVAILACNIETFPVYIWITWLTRYLQYNYTTFNNSMTIVTNRQFMTLRRKNSYRAGTRPAPTQILTYQPNTSCCFWINAWIPVSANANMASACSRVNALPSAVPCTSTKPPNWLITTFISVSQLESSI